MIYKTLNDNLRLGQIFRVVIIPGQFANKGNKNILDLNDYKAVIAKLIRLMKRKSKRVN